MEVGHILTLCPVVLRLFLNKLLAEQAQSHHLFSVLLHMHIHRVPSHNGCGLCILQLFKEQIYICLAFVSPEKCVRTVCNGAIFAISR